MTACFDNCGSIHGFCNDTLQECQCSYPWVNLGDFVPTPDLVCGINFDVSKGLWAVSIVIHAVYLGLLALSCVQLRRGTFKRELSERITLGNMMVSSALNLIVSVLEVSARFPGERSIGLDLATTVLYSLAELGIMCHTLLLPFVQSGTSVLPFAVAASSTLKPRKNLLAASYMAMFLMMLVAQALVIVLVFFPALVVQLLSTSFAIYFIITAVTGGVSYLLVRTLVIKVNLLGNSHSHNVSSAQKQGFEQTRKRATGTKHVSLIVLFLYAPQFLVFAISPVSLWRSAWAWVPIKVCIVCIFEFRHPYLSLTTSYSHRARDTNDKTIDGNEIEEQDKATALQATMLLSGLDAKSGKRKKHLAMVEEEKTVDIRTEPGIDADTF